MCGIIGYIGYRQAFPILINGLHRLEYRGYDSAGISLLNNGLKIYKTHGKVSDLEACVIDKDLSGTVGMGHTRWATHGEPTDINAHPHFSPSHKLAIIHNGIIENYKTLKEELISRDYQFKSETDTEVIIHLVEDIIKNEHVDIVEATRLALSQVIGAFAIVILSENNPDMLIAAKRGSPLVIGVGDDEYFVASDPSPIIEYTNKVVYLEDDEIAVIQKNKDLKIITIKNLEKTPYIQQLEMSLSQIEKGGYEHFMLKEIFEQPQSVKDSMRGRLSLAKQTIALGGIVEYENRLLTAPRIILVGCGTSWHAGLVGEYLLEDLARIPVEVEYASEFRYRNPVLHENDVVIAISQSGETADTLAAVKLAKSKGAIPLGICNVVGSSIARETVAGSYTHAGPEIGVASTKAFTAQITILTMMALMLGYKKGVIPKSRFIQHLHDLNEIAEKMQITLEKTNEPIKHIASQFKDARNFLYLGRGYSYPVALEGALKLKEISYIHAEGYPAAEMKHGPIALIDENMPVVFIAPQSNIYDKTVSNIQEVKARKGIIISIVSEGDDTVKKLSDYYIEIPKTQEFLVPLVATIPLQLLAYHIAVLRGCNVDQPRNLAKSVTVE
ncbi:MAG: glutamine--fructose-6-phosphate transaminase (isomerizing) [Bacteroidales bacterium]|jgi:glucosamine--fructose-6-phosphate aminotransferase (isomerizing)|nr:glutamine--fructose-6-phosphate transaminase (isomerizing) [Bacteroidales bacterium]MDI9575004.1 glutamine--fructose-6-phosphate transaminase (isomerizing) [Bacteroidota bacterium]MDY0401573.1 glutamine--fructose-6-phosphate transaminase (isomerizing) [Bacteroidales bacterium]HOB78229.1 glutamine--fructose-6-phosphate transaminase (isomerizing) [Bacteroidales bacterium]HPZ61644.1 glutamine--fructose-6-phosphate transaminase (isomerizing) [Bacteroidales bacterium]